MARESSLLIFRTLACAAALLIGYAFIIQCAHPDIIAASTPSLTNRVSMERHIYGHAAANVIVGSSMSRRLLAADLGPTFHQFGAGREKCVDRSGDCCVQPRHAQTRLYRNQPDRIGRGRKSSTESFPRTTLFAS